MTHIDEHQKFFVGRKLITWTIVLFVALLILGEMLVRAPAFQQALVSYINPFEQTHYSPIIDHYTRIREYAAQTDSINCVFGGSSLVQTGINPHIFTTALSSENDAQISCYNLGMDASTLSSTAPTILYFSQDNPINYVLIGVQTLQFTNVGDQPAFFTEDQIDDNDWLQYALGKFNLGGWISENLRLSNIVTSVVSSAFPVAGFGVQATNHFRPEAPRIINIDGYGPLLGFRDPSPLYQPTSNLYATDTSIDLDPQDFAALDELIERSQNGNFELIFVEMPVNDPSNVVNEVMDQVSILIRDQGIPFLSTRGLAPLPPTAFSDQTHMHINGSFMFSEWLGTQIGRAIATGALENVNDPLWTPTLESWGDAVFKDTLGLSETRYNEYLTYSASFDLVPENAIVFNPSDDVWDRELLQSLVGFTVDWQADLTDQDRLNIFQLMVTLGVMRYEDELALASAATSPIDRWRATLDPNLLLDLDIEYVICRVELVDTSIEHCPTSLQNNPQYIPIAQWDFDPLYEQYHLYQVVNTP